MKLSITGSREFGNFKIISKVLTYIQMKAQEQNPDRDIHIISGAHVDDYKNNRNMVDATALKWAADNSEPFTMFIPKWNKYGKSAGNRRNPKIVDEGWFTLSFWDGKSHGCGNTIEYAKSKNKYLGNVSPDGEFELTELGKNIFTDLGIKV